MSPLHRIYSSASNVQNYPFLVTRLRPVNMLNGSPDRTSTGELDIPDTNSTQIEGNVTFSDTKNGRRYKTPSGGPPDGSDPHTLRMPNGKHLTQKVALGLIFLGSSGLGWLTHVKEDLFGLLTKPVKISSIFVALFTGAVGLATCIARTPTEMTGFQTDFGHGLH